MIAPNMLKWIDTPSKRKWIPNKFVHHVSSTMQLIDILFEVDALARIVRTMGATYWKFDGDSCQIETVGLTPQPPRGSEQNIICNNFLEKNNTALHVVSIMLKGYNLPGVLPPELVEAAIPSRDVRAFHTIFSFDLFNYFHFYLICSDFAYNYLGGTIPPEWASAQLSSISVLANRLSGEIPKELGNITSLTYLNLEANQFSGIVPPVLGDLINLKTLILSSNQFFGNLPTTLAGLRSLTDFRINDNNLSGPIPEFIQNWKQLTRMRISDINGTTQAFPMLIKMTGIDFEELQDFWRNPRIHLENEVSGNVVRNAFKAVEDGFSWFSLLHYCNVYWAS
ncbi:putative LRR receptor-like serine/threonine-protein kinase RFK1 [Vitis vinifera]|uniref:Putative LRR receptor-like serine/threonine-protein kinase RFK1 n=1 Tax=Vitis vinifera TaxID=29760 RepID=A0A438CQ05_VITVI|nr:putative LRR receptor-like serine/threonine-protein kinase RFK1 [Vitis vinifera]